MLKDKDAVVIDVRNHYEVDIGRIQPPEGGATFINPEMRNSHEFPKWLNLPETKKQLEGKRVMMYCTGGIRCERASALISQMERVGDLKKTKGIAMVRGGVDRYLKTFPEERRVLEREELLVRFERSSNGRERRRVGNV